MEMQSTAKQRSSESKCPRYRARCRIDDRQLRSLAAGGALLCGPGLRMWRHDPHSYCALPFTARSALPALWLIEFRIVARIPYRRLSPAVLTRRPPILPPRSGALRPNSLCVLDEPVCSRHQRVGAPSASSTTYDPSPCPPSPAPSSSATVPPRATFRPPTPRLAPPAARSQ